MLWVGIVEGNAWLGALATEVGRVLTPLGFAPDARDYHPHVTLARARANPVDVRDVVGAITTRDYGDAWTVTEVVLYESILRRAGAEYVPRARVRLRA